MTFTQVFKEKWKYGGWTVKIITINVIIFIFINLIINIDQAFLLRHRGGGYMSWVDTLFVLPDDFSLILERPWTILTYMFAHEGFIHLAFNMLWFYFGAQLFKQFLEEKRIIYMYVLGGIVSAAFQILAANFIPWFQVSMYSGLIGASGAVYAVFMAVSFYRPMTPVMLFGLFEVRLIYIALFLVISDFLRVTSLSSTAHIAHLGGALFGILAALQLELFDKLVNKLDRFFWIFSGGVAKMRSRMFLRKREVPQTRHYHKADEKYFETKQEIQAKIDAILDKIKAKGYDGLTKAEKDYLFTHKDRL